MPRVSVLGDWILIKSLGKTALFHIPEVCNQIGRKLRNRILKACCLGRSEFVTEISLCKTTFDFSPLCEMLSNSERIRCGENGVAD